MTLREAAPELNDNQWKLVARLISENIIGEDLPRPKADWLTNKDLDRANINKFKAELRAKLTKELESE